MVESRISRMHSLTCHQCIAMLTPRSLVAVLRGGGVLLHRGAEDQHVEGGAGLGEPPHLHLRALAAGRDGGAADRAGGAQAPEPRDLQGDLPHRLQTGPAGQHGRQHREVPHGQTGQTQEIPAELDHMYLKVIVSLISQIKKGAMPMHCSYCSIYDHI